MKEVWGDDLYYIYMYNCMGDRVMLTTPKLKELQKPKTRHTPNFIRSRCMVMEKCHQIFPPTYNSTCMCDDLYHVCTFTWGAEGNADYTKAKGVSEPKI